MSKLTIKTLSVSLSVEKLREDNGLSLCDIVAKQLGHRDFNITSLRFVGYLDNDFWRYSFSNNALFLQNDQGSSFFDLFQDHPIALNYRHHSGTMTLTGPGSAEKVLIMLELTIGGPTYNDGVVALTIPVDVAVKTASNIAVDDGNVTADGREWQDCKFDGIGKFVPMYNLKKEIIGFTLVQE